jgi:hypothetical protein
LGPDVCTTLTYNTYTQFFTPYTVYKTARQYRNAIENATMLMVSNDAFEGPLGPPYSENLPPTKAQFEFSSFPLRISYTVNVTACPGATRITRGVMPL